MVGDSLTSDVLGANRFGFDSCWINSKGKRNDTQIVTIQSHPTKI